MSPFILGSRWQGYFFSWELLPPPRGEPLWPAGCMWPWPLQWVLPGPRSEEGIRACQLFLCSQPAVPLGPVPWFLDSQSRWDTQAWDLPPWETVPHSRLTAGYGASGPHSQFPGCRASQYHLPVLWGFADLAGQGLGPPRCWTAGRARRPRRGLRGLVRALRRQQAGSSLAPGRSPGPRPRGEGEAPQRGPRRRGGDRGADGPPAGESHAGRAQAEHREGGAVLAEQQPDLLVVRVGVQRLVVLVVLVLGGRAVPACARAARGPERGGRGLHGALLAPLGPAVLEPHLVGEGL